MKVRVLGCSGAIAKDCRTTSFLIDDHVLIDAGTGVGDLTLDEMRKIDHVFLTHSHLDHIAALPLMLDAVASLRTHSLVVYALNETLDALRAHVFNDVIWPDFTRIPNLQIPYLQLRPLSIGQNFSVCSYRLEVLPAKHSVPAVGYAVQGPRGWWVYSGDTAEGNPQFWQRVNLMHANEGVAALVIETAFSNREEGLAKKSGHLFPAGLMRELAELQFGINSFPIYITHVKPAEGDLIMREISAATKKPLVFVNLRGVQMIDC